jgi:hypothetical protein
MPALTFSDHFLSSFASLKSTQPPGTPHAAIMKALSARWSTVKRQAQAHQQMTRESPSKLMVEEEPEVQGASEERSVGQLSFE